MHFTVREEAVDRAVTLLAAAAAAVAVGRLVARAVAAVLLRLVQRWGGLALLLETGAVVLAFVALCVDSGLVVPMALLSLVAAVVMGWSAGSVRALFSFFFVVVSVAVPPLVAHSIVTQAPVDRGDWASSYRGQRALLPRAADRCDHPRLREAFVYYDDVHITLDGGGAAVVPCDAIIDGPAPGSDAAATLHHSVVSVGERLHLAGLHRADGSDSDSDGDGALFRDTIVLAGADSVLRRSTLHCRLADHRGRPAPCLRAVPSTRFDDVVLRVFDDSDGRRWTIAVDGDGAASCDALRKRVAAALAGVGAEVPATAVVRCADAVSPSAALSQLADSAAAGDFAANMPLLVAVRWHLPGLVRAARDAFSLLSEAIGGPVAVATVAGGAALLRGARVLWVLLRAAAAQGAPQAAAAARHAHGWLLGLLCGGGADPPLLRCARPPSAEWFSAGAAAHDQLAAAVAAAADVLELVPGVWAVVQWGWAAELSATVALIRAGAAVGTVAYVAVLRPTARGAAVVGGAAARGLPHAVVPLRAAAAVVRGSPLGRVAGGAARWVLAQEGRLLALEWAALRLTTAALLRAAAAVAVAAWVAVEAVVWGAQVVLRWYLGTSFSMQLVISVLQTLLLLVAVRNEVRELVALEAAERARAERAAASPVGAGLGLASMARSLSRRLRGSRVVAQAGGVALFARAHYYTCMQYVVTHAVLVLVLIGLSVLPLTGRLHTLTLHFVFPYMSSEVFLSFFVKPHPERAQVAALCGGRLALAILLQRTIGDFLYRLIRDLLLALGLLGAVVAAIWAWPHRDILVRRVATVIADSLSNTPMRGTPTPPQAPVLQSSSSSAEDADADAVARAIGLDDAAHEEGVAGGAREASQESNHSGRSSSGGTVTPTTPSEKGSDDALQGAASTGSDTATSNAEAAAP